MTLNKKEIELIYDGLNRDGIEKNEGCHFFQYVETMTDLGLIFFHAFHIYVNYLS